MYVLVIMLSPHTQHTHTHTYYGIHYYHDLKHSNWMSTILCEWNEDKKQKNFYWQIHLNNVGISLTMIICIYFYLIKLKLFKNDFNWYAGRNQLDIRLLYSIYEYIM